MSKREQDFLQLDPVVGGKPFVRLVALGLGLGAAVGILATVSLPAAAVLAAVVAGVALSRGRLPRLVRLGLILATGVPLAAAGSSPNTFLSVPLGPINPPFQILLAIGIAALTIVLATDESLSYLLSVLRRGASGMALVWVTAAFVLFLLGVSRNGIAPSGRQFMYFSVYVWVIPVIIVSRRRAGQALSGMLAPILVGTILSALIALAAFAVTPIREFFFSATGWAGSTRVYFSTTSVYVLMLPIALLLAGNRSAGRLRPLGLVAAVLMIGSMLASQTRAQMAACALNVILVVLLPGTWRLGVRRWRILASIALIVPVVLTALTLASSLGVQSAAVLPQVLSERFGSLLSVTDDPNYQSRALTTQIAMRRWQEDPVSLVSGQGLGAPIGQYAPGGSATPYSLNPFVDNCWATLAVQGGLIALTPFALVFVAAFVSFIRAGRSIADPQERLIARALAVSLPGLMFDSTLVTNHLLHDPGVIVALCTLVAAADVVWCSQRDAASLATAARSRG